MIYKLIVNAAFLAIGYYIGKEVSRAEYVRRQARKVQGSTSRVAEQERTGDTVGESGDRRDA